MIKRLIVCRTGLEIGRIRRRQTDEVADQFLQVVERVFIVEQPAPLGPLVLWNSTVGELYPYVVVDRVQSWLRSDDWYETFRGGTAQLLEYMTCNLDRMNNLL